MAIIGNTFYNQRFGQTLDGTPTSDYIYGYDGDDWLYGGGGGDVIYGGSGNDNIFPSVSWAQNHNGYWGAVYAEGGAGNDFIRLSMSFSDGNTLYGDNWDGARTSDGRDTIVGSHGKNSIYGGGNNDVIVGGDDIDYLYGDWNGTEYTNDGNDELYGLGGNDQIYGGGGNDTISGGTGTDWLTGGSGFNTFFYRDVNDSTGWGSGGYNYNLADKITDFYSPYDKIDFFTGNGGTPANYAEFSFANNGMGYREAFNYAASKAEAYFAYSNKQYVFATDGYDGYLFADQNGDHVVDTRIELRGVNSLSGFDYWDVV
jgi:Ca2+-binding RTX toxin-like protein